MTDDAMSLQVLAGKSANVDFLRTMIGHAAQRLKDQKVGFLPVLDVPPFFSPV